MRWTIIRCTILLIGWQLVSSDASSAATPVRIGSGIVIAQAGEDVLQKFLKAFDDIVGGLDHPLLKRFKGAPERMIEKERPVQRRQPMRVRPAQRVVPAEQLKLREQRLESHAAAVERWIAAQIELDDPQRAAIHLVLQDAAKAPAQQDRQQARGVGVQRQLLDYVPIIFANPGGAASDFYHFKLWKQIHSHLSESQREALTLAVEERKDFIRDQFLRSIVCRVDRRLFLLPESRAAFSAELKPRLHHLFSGLYAFNPQPYYLPYESLNDAISPAVIDTLRTPTQQESLRDLAAPNASQHLIFSTSEDFSEWYKKLDAQVAAQQEKFNRATQVRADYYADQLGLTPQHLRKLSVAGKGVATIEVSQWKQQTIAQLRSWEQRAGQFNGNASFGVGMIDTSRIDDQPLWRHTIETLSSEVNQKKMDRESRLLIDEAAGIVGFLDKELWLDVDQRERLMPLVQAAMPKSTNVVYNYLHELLVLAAVANKLSQQDLKKVLHEDQIAAFHQMVEALGIQNNVVRLPNIQQNRMQMPIPR